MIRRSLCVAALLGGLAATAAKADFLTYEEQSRTGRMNIGGGIGFLLDPDSFLLAAEFGYFVHHNWSLGPLLQMGVNDNHFLLAPSLNVKGVIDIPREGFWRRLKPFGQMGLGIAYANVDRRNADGDDIGFLLNFGFGAEIFLNREFSMGNNLMFNILPVDVLGDRFFFSWQFITARYHF